MKTYKNGFGVECNGPIYHPDNERQETYKYLKDYLEKNKYLGNLLEVGCGDGYLSTILNKQSYNYFGVTLRNAEVKWGNEKQINIKVGDILALPHTDNEFDIVLSVKTIEYVSTQDQAIQELCRVSKNFVVIIYDCYPNLQSNVGTDYYNILTEFGVTKLLEINDFKTIHKERLEQEKNRCGHVLFIAEKNKK